MALFKSQVQDAVNKRKEEADKLLNSSKHQQTKRVCVCSWKVSSRTYLVGVQFIGHLSPELKVGDEYQYDGQTMTIHYIAEKPEVIKQAKQVEVFNPDIDAFEGCLDG